MTEHDSLPTGYTTAQVARLLDLTPDEIRRFVRDGVVQPQRAPSGRLVFGFRDLVLLRTARDLASRVPTRQVRQALRTLRDRRPEDGLANVRITTDGAGVVVRDGDGAWVADTGQLLLEFDGPRPTPVVTRLDTGSTLDTVDPDEESEFGAQDWYELGCDVEDFRPAEAAEAYRRSLELDPLHVEARVNLGRLLHVERDYDAAEREYRFALQYDPRNVTAAFNRAVALEDLDRVDEALAAYHIVLQIDPGYADAHYNAASLCEAMGRPQDALRHLREYRRLTRGES